MHFVYLEGRSCCPAEAMACEILDPAEWTTSGENVNSFVSPFWHINRVSYSLLVSTYLEIFYLKVKIH